MPKKESGLTRELCRILEQQGCMVLPIIGSSWSPPGWPDRYIAHKGLACFVEFKMLGGRLSPVQERIIGLLRLNGAKVVVAYFSECGRFVGCEGCEWTSFGKFLAQLKEVCGVSNEAVKV